jgi:hypothetical protein
MPCSAIATSVPQLLSISHETAYRYRRPVTFNERRAVFPPRDSHDMRVIDARPSRGNAAYRFAATP